eukprot:2961911-Amphidinium_carterae.1
MGSAAHVPRDSHWVTPPRRGRRELDAGAEQRSDYLITICTCGQSRCTKSLIIVFCSAVILHHMSHSDDACYQVEKHQHFETIPRTRFPASCS